MTAALLALLLACGDVTVRQPEIDAPVAEDAGWDEVRRSMVRARYCYRSRPEYCITDRKHLDVIVQHALDRHFDGVMPARRRDLDELTRDAINGYIRWLRTEDGLAALGGRVRAYYDDPEVELVPGKGVSVRVGVPPGRFSAIGDTRRPDAPLVVLSPLLSRGELSTREIARLLQRYIERYPDEPAYRLYVTVPKGLAGLRRLDIRLYRDLDRIVVQDLDVPGTAWVSDPLEGDLSPYLGGAVSLHTSALRQCPVNAAGRPVCDDEPSPR